MLSVMHDIGLPVEKALGTTPEVDDVVLGVPDSEIDILSDALPNALPKALLYPVPDALPVSVTVPPITEPHQDKFSD